MNSYIFREYDIRGKVAEDFGDDVVISLGKGFGTWLRRQGGTRLALSGDIRSSTPKLKAKFTEGVLSTGIDIIDVGIVPTPVNYYSMILLDVDGAVQITGSHNPPEYNGFKMSHTKGAVYGDQIQSIRQIIENGDFETGEGTSEQLEILDDYMNMILERVFVNKELKVVLDCGNAAGGLIAPELFRKLGVDLTELYCEVDGSFPNHHPDPTVEKNITELIKTMSTGDYDVGIAYDGDADRIGVIDDRGRIVWADYLMILFLDEVIRNDDEEIIFDVKCSQALEQEIEKRGGKPVMWKTGHSLIKQKMKDSKSPFAGEMSGHIFFADDYFGYDDAIYVSARLLETLSKTDKKLSEIIDQYPQFESTPEIRMDTVDDAEKFKIAKKAKEYFSTIYDYTDVDGIRIKFGDGWGLVRASNTQPVIVCRFEAKTRDRLKEIKDIVMTKLHEFGELEVAK